MGLDQYAYALKGEERVKHANLQGWMENLYRNQGGTKIFNCIDLVLSEEDLDNLEASYQSLEHARGFFWGESYPKDNDKTKAFIDKARGYIKDGYEIVYDSWW
jgi:hypothetical protein